MNDRLQVAERLYCAWVRREDKVHPITFDVDTRYTHYLDTHAVRPRPRWETLTPVEQETWRCVADAAGELLAEAMGAVST